MLQQVPNQAGLAGTKKAGNDGSGNFQGHDDLLVRILLHLNGASVGWAALMANGRLCLQNSWPAGRR